MPCVSILRTALPLTLLASCAALVVALTYHLTREPIARQARLAQEQELLEIVPRNRHDNAMLDDTIAVGPQDKGLGLTAQRRIHIARLHGDVVAVILPVIAPDGFAGDIELRVGVNRDGSIAGVRVVEHHETAGLGDRIELEHSDWLLGFNGRSLEHPAMDAWAVRRDHGAFDQFTGATITPRAVVTATKRALQFARDNRARLFGDASPAPTRSN